MSNNYTRVKQTQFTTELEHSYRIRKSALLDVLTQLQSPRASIITQAWLRTERRETEEGGVYIIKDARTRGRDYRKRQDTLGIHNQDIPPEQQQRGRNRGVSARRL